MQKAIDQVAQNYATLVIAHRLSTIKKADSILVIEKGRILEEGTHNNLLEKKEILGDESGAWITIIRKR